MPRAELACLRIPGPVALGLCRRRSGLVPSLLALLGLDARTLRLGSRGDLPELGQDLLPKALAITGRIFADLAEHRLLAMPPHDLVARRTARHDPLIGERVGLFRIADTLHESFKRWLEVLLTVSFDGPLDIRLETDCGELLRELLGQRLLNFPEHLRGVFKQPCFQVGGELIRLIPLRPLLWLLLLLQFLATTTLLTQLVQESDLARRQRRFAFTHSMLITIRARLRLGWRLLRLRRRLLRLLPLRLLL